MMKLHKLVGLVVCGWLSWTGTVHADAVTDWHAIAVKERVMRSKENINTMLDIFGAIERRDERRFLALVHPDVEMHWPPSLPYGGTAQGLQQETWSATWGPLQPTEAERRMEPRVVAASEEEIVVLWHQRGITPAGDRFDGEVLGLYRVHGGKLTRAQMFYFDTTALLSFLAKAKSQATAPQP